MQIRYDVIVIYVSECMLTYPAFMTNRNMNIRTYFLSITVPHIHVLVNLQPCVIVILPITD